MNTWSLSKKGMKTLLAAEGGRQGLKEKGILQALCSLSHTSSITCWEGIWESLHALCPPIHYSNPVLTWAATEVRVHDSSFKKKSTCVTSSWHQSPAQEQLWGTFYELERSNWQIILALGKFYEGLHCEHCVITSAQCKAFMPGVSTILSYWSKSNNQQQWTTVDGFAPSTKPMSGVSACSITYGKK